MNYGYIAVARLKPEADLEQARSEMDTISRRLAQQYPDTNEGVGAIVAPMLKHTVAGVSRAPFVLLAAVLCLLLIGCANLTNLLVARAIARRSDDRDSFVTKCRHIQCQFFGRTFLA